MPTSTLISYSLDAGNYVWDAVTGILFSSGLGLFFVALLIITGVVCLTIAFLKGVFNMR